jgi:hypothetical protein
MVLKLLTPWNGKVVGDVIRFIAEVQWLKMILQRRRITDWAEFERDNKFSKNFINGTQSRHFYNVVVVSKVSGIPQGGTDIVGLNERLDAYGFTRLLPSSIMKELVQLED